MRSADNGSRGPVNFPSPERIHGGSAERRRVGVRPSALGFGRASDLQHWVWTAKHLYAAPSERARIETEPPETRRFPSFDLAWGYFAIFSHSIVASAEDVSTM